MLAQELCQKRFERSQSFLETLEVQQRIEFRDLVTGNESWINLDMTPDLIWIGAEEKSHAIAHDESATKSMLTMF
jgi:hypothetical protein